VSSRFLAPFCLAVGLRRSFGRPPRGCCLFFVFSGISRRLKDFFFGFLAEALRGECASGSVFCFCYGFVTSVLLFEPFLMISPVWALLFGQIDWDLGVPLLFAVRLIPLVMVPPWRRSSFHVFSLHCQRRYICLRIPSVFGRSPPGVPIEGSSSFCWF